MLASIDQITLILFCSPFVKILTIFAILRIGLSLSNAEFGIITSILAVAIAILIINSSSNSSKLDLFNKSKPANSQELAGFMERNSDAAMLASIFSAVNKDRPNLEKTKPSFDLLLVSFLITELKKAFEIGLLILVPFLLIDLIVINIFMLLGVQSFNPILVSLPLKVLAFVGADVWLLITTKMVGGYL